MHNVVDKKLFLYSNSIQKQLYHILLRKNHNFVATLFPSSYQTLGYVCRLYTMDNVNIYQSLLAMCGLWSLYSVKAHVPSTSDITQLRRE